MTLKTMRKYLLDRYDWRRQRDPADQAGYEADTAAVKAISRARTWAALEEAAPSGYEMAVANRCRREDL